MILCSTKQACVDIAIPICHTQQALSHYSVTVILVQVKIAGRHWFNIDKLFNGMDPFKLGSFPSKMVPKSVIRIVLALAALEAGVNFPEPRASSRR
jgi:hypothetical protein